MVSYVISHKSPDTDSICGSIMLSKYLGLDSKESIPFKLGEINNETKFVLDRFGFMAPDTAVSLDKGADVYLVDHNEEKQSIDNLEDLNIKGIVDHHKFKFETSEPLFIRAEPLGAACSVIAKMFFERGFELSGEEAGLLISGIISDTLYFRSPTTTSEDKQIVAKLNEIAKIDDIEAYSLEIFDAKSDLGDISAVEMVKSDYKKFDFGLKKFGIGFFETTNPDYALSRKGEICDAIKEVKDSEGLDGVIFCVVDILKEQNTTFLVDDFERDAVCSAFNVTSKDFLADLGSILSRKKEIVPVLEKHFK